MYVLLVVTHKTVAFNCSMASAALSLFTITSMAIKQDIEDNVLIKKSNCQN